LRFPLVGVKSSRSSEKTNSSTSDHRRTNEGGDIKGTRTTSIAEALLAAAVLLGETGSPTTAREKKTDPPFTPAKLTERMLHRRAIEPVMWGMPAVNYDLILHEMLSRTPGWFVYFRIYGPEQAAFDGTWKPGDFEQVN
jgi:hypothetical protein